MKLDIFAKMLRDRRRSLIGMTVCLLALVAMYVALFPTLQTQAAQFEEMIESYPEAFRAFFNISDLDSPEGYLGTELFSFMMPLILLLYAIGAATDATAGEEERGTIDLILAMPVTRTSFVLQKFAAVAVGLAIIGGATFVLIAGVGPLFELNISWTGLAAGIVYQVLAAMGFGAIALTIACATGRRGVSRAMTAVLAVGAFLLDTFSRLSDAIAPWRVLSPMYHAVGSDPLRGGFELPHLSFLLLTALAFTIAAPVVFERRDLAV